MYLAILLIDALLKPLGLTVMGVIETEDMIGPDGWVVREITSRHWTIGPRLA